MTTTLTARLRRHLRVKRYAMANDHAAFQKAILDNPDDHTTRQVYADYLDETDTGAPGASAILRDPDPETGYRYGSEWKREQVPSEALDFLTKLPEPQPPKPRRYASYDVNTPSVSISIPVPGPATPAPKPKPAPQPAPAPAPAPPAAPAPAPEPTPRAFIFPFAPAPRRRMARGKPRRYAHADEPAMHAAIAANPQDNTAGHAYSDMLEENGKPAHAEVVRNYIKRTGQPAMVRRRGMLDWTADPDIPWETGVMAGPVGHLEPADRDYQTDPITEQEPGWWRVHLFRRTPDRRILHWTANVNGREHAAALVRRLHAEGQQSVPPGGEVLLDANAGNFVHLPDRYQRLARRTLKVIPHAEPESVVLLPGRRSLCVPPESPARTVLLARLRARRRQG